MNTSLLFRNWNRLIAAYPSYTLCFVYALCALAYKLKYVYRLYTYADCVRVQNVQREPQGWSIVRVEQTLLSCGGGVLMVPLRFGFGLVYNTPALSNAGRMV